MVLSFPGRIAEDPPLVWISIVQYGIFTIGPHVQEDFSLTLCSSLRFNCLYKEYRVECVRQGSASLITKCLLKPEQG